MYDPATGTWAAAGSLSAGRAYASATLIPDGRVLVTGGFTGSGYLDSADLYDGGLDYLPTWQPTVNTTTSPLVLTFGLTATGTGFRGNSWSEASGGGFSNSSSNYPLVQLRRLDNGQTIWLPIHTFSETEFTTLSVTGIAPGYAQVTVFVNGIPSVARPVLIVNPNQIYLPLITRSQ